MNPAFPRLSARSIRSWFVAALALVTHLGALPIGNQPRYTFYPEAGHDSWTEAYHDPSLFTWLLQQRRP